VCVTWHTRDRIGTGYLKFKDFKKFIDRYPNFKHVELSCKGEIFLNPELTDIIKYAYEKKVILSAYGGVNLNSISEKTAGYLAKYKFNAIVVAIDGASSETYSVYRKGGSFTNVIENIKKINHYKQVYNSEFPRLIWKFVIFGHNEHEIDSAKKIAKDLGMEFTHVFNVEPSYSPVVDTKYVKEQTGYASLQEFEQANNTKNCLDTCKGLWRSPQINWDGRLMGCACRSVGFPINVFEIGLERSLNDEKYIYAKKMLLGKVEPREDVPCCGCGIYEWRREHKCFISAWDVVWAPLISRLVPAKARATLHLLIPARIRNMIKKAIGRL